jgi:hypothetical protein
VAIRGALLDGQRWIVERASASAERCLAAIRLCDFARSVAPLDATAKPKIS